MEVQGKQGKGSSRPLTEGIAAGRVRDWGLRRSQTCRRRDEGGAVEGRKSVSAVETNVRSAALFLQVKILAADMPGEMQAHACRCARRAHDSLEKPTTKLIAYTLKKEFDRAYGPAWQCIVGSSFGSFVTHSTGSFLYFAMEKLLILVYRTKVQRLLD